jgi:hypothetical protein
MLTNSVERKKMPSHKRSDAQRRYGNVCPHFFALTSSTRQDLYSHTPFALPPPSLVQTYLSYILYSSRPTVVRMSYGTYICRVIAKDQKGQLTLFAQRTFQTLHHSSSRKLTTVETRHLFTNNKQPGTICWFSYALNHRLLSSFSTKDLLLEDYEQVFHNFQNVTSLNFTTQFPNL